MTRFKDTYNQFASVSEFDVSGTYIASIPIEPPDSRLRLAGIADREHFIRAVRTGELTLSNLLIARSSLRGAVIAIAAPYKTNGRVAGVGVGVLDLTRLAEFLDAYRTLPSASITIVDGEGKVISASGSSGRRANQSLINEPVLKAATAATGPFQYDADANRGGTQVAAVATVPNHGWKVIVEEPLVVMQLQNPRFYVVSFALVGLALIATMVAARRMSRRVSQPLEELVTVVRNVSVQHHYEPAVVPASDIEEIDTLGRDIVRMQQRLNQSYSQLDRKSTRLNSSHVSESRMPSSA